ncbi:DUF421 domain-containing protein [Paenibacillus sp.]|uniref:DUF421 domain-containing protein n=1 Tax=Paenibacillus sp. TaxID=58172 RepID=UPI002D65499D|nr:DUF421 domain-containing protein [Paenibacillus sp.]HZG57614.1 DUF421 domain-containing protein [Paenibacillus sp.]
MHPFADLWLVVSRATTAFPLMLLAALFMGKRSVGELPVFDLLVVLTLGSIVAADIVDPRIDHAHTAAAIVMVVVLERLFSWAAVRFRRFRMVTSFEATVVVYEGKLLSRNIGSIRYTVDNVLQMLRDKGVFDLGLVQMAIVEGNGKLTVLRRGEPYSFTVVVEGVVNDEPLRRQGLSREWLEQRLREQGIASVDDVFYAALSEDGALRASRRGETPEGLQPSWR